MSLLDVLRAKFPDNEKLKALSDPDIVSTLAQATGKDLPYVADKLGLSYADYVQNEGFWEDTGSDVAVGVSDIPGVAAGIVDLVNPLAWAGTDYTLSKGWDAVEDATGLADWRARQGVTLSPERLAQEQAVAEAFKNEGLGAAAWEALTSPRAFVGAAARSLPASLASGFGLGMPLRAAATARGMDRLAKVAPWLAEGAHAGGAGVDQATEAGVDPAMANLVGLGTGVTTGAIGGTIGATARRFGVDDFQAAMAGAAPATRTIVNEAGETVEGSLRPWYQRIPMAAGVEMAQEAPQSGTEQMWQNYAQGKPLMEGVPQQAVMGGLAGGVMGAGFGLFPRGRKIDRNVQTDLLQDEQLDPTKGLDTTRFNAPSDVSSIRNQVGLNTAEGLSNWAGVRGQGDTSGYTSDLTASYNEPSGHRVADKVTGVERELSTGDWLYYQATGQLPTTTDPVKVEGKPKPVEGVTPEMQRLLDVAQRLPMAADPTKIKPGEVTANGHRASGRPTKDAVNWATTLSGLKTEDEVNKAVEKGTRSRAGYWQWVMPMAAARIQEIKAEQAKTTAQQAKQNDTVDGPGVPVTPTIAQNAQPVEGAVPPAPTTSSVAQDEVSPSGATIPSGVPPSGATSSGSSVLDMALEIPYEAPVWDQATGTTTKTSGTSKILDYGGRKLIVLNINGVQVPFYQSSGQAGKKNVPAGKWYPILGIDPDSGWINKGTEADITSYYGSDLLRQYAEMLDNEIGDIRSRDTDPKVGMRGPQLAFVNQGLNPTPNEAGAYAKLQDNLVNLMGRLGYKPNEPGATPSTTTPETPTNALSGQTTPQASQETGTTAPDALAPAELTPLTPPVAEGGQALVPVAGTALAETTDSTEVLRGAVRQAVASDPGLSKKIRGMTASRPEKAEQLVDAIGGFLLRQFGVGENVSGKVKGQSGGDSRTFAQELIDTGVLPRVSHAWVNERLNELLPALAKIPELRTALESFAGRGREFTESELDTGQNNLVANYGDNDAALVASLNDNREVGGLDKGDLGMEGTEKKVSPNALAAWAELSNRDDGTPDPEIPAFGRLSEDQRAEWTAVADAFKDAGLPFATLRPQFRKIVYGLQPSSNETAAQNQVANIVAAPKIVKEIKRANAKARKNDTDSEPGTGPGTGPGAGPDYGGGQPLPVVGQPAQGSPPAPGAQVPRAGGNRGRVVPPTGSGRTFDAGGNLLDPVQLAAEQLSIPRLPEGRTSGNAPTPMHIKAWRQAAQQDPLAEVSNVSEETAAEELKQVSAALATQGLDAISAWKDPRNATQGRVALRRALMDRANAAVETPKTQVQQGLGEDVAATNPTTEQTLRDTIASLLGKGHNWRIHVYATPEAAHAAGHTPRKVGNAYGWVEADQKGVKHAYFIVNRIEQGTELGKFLHEVGAHIGLENILSPALYQNLVNQLRKWAALNNDSLESRLAKAALARVESAQAESTRAGREGLDQAGQDSELIAYFLEEAVKAGVDPTATKANSPLGTWFMRLWTAFKRALRKLRIDNLDALTPQDVVDLAYGAARLSLVERKNAAPQRVTEAMPTQYGVDVPSHASAISEAVQNQLSKGGTGVKSNLLGWLRLDQLAEQYGKLLPMVAELNKLFNQMSTKAKHWLNRADHVIRMWDMLTPKQKELMHWIMGNATVEGYDPDDTKTTAKNDQQRLLDQKWKQLQALDAANPKMKAATVYRAARKHYQDDMQEAIDYLNGLKTQAKGANDKQLDSMITTLKALTKKSKGVYFPLMRFGDFYTVGMSSQLHALHQKRKALLDKGRALDEAEEKLYQKLRKDEKHYQVTGHDSERQARKHADKLRAQGMQATSNVGRYSQDAVRNTLSKDMDSFNQLLAELEVPKGVASRLQTAYESLLIDALPEGHTLKRQMDRDGIAGWDTDMRRVFAKSTQSRAFALSRLINMRQVQEQMAQLKRAGESFEPNAQLASPLYNELMARQELAYTRSEDPWWTRTATTWNYLTMLSFSPAFWLLNLSQVPVVTLPWLAARNGNQYGATMTGLAKAAGQTAKLIKWSIEGNEWRAELDTTRAIPGISQDEKQLLLDMQDAGKLEFTIGQDIGAVAEGKSDFMAKLTRSINTPTHATELINRASTALTAYRISRKNGNDHAKAVEFAIRASDTTHVNYDPVVGARNMQTVFGSAPLAKIVFQFWKFQQGMAYLALSTMKDAWNHPDPAIKKQARDTAIGMTLTLTSTAGAFGLPFVGSALGLLTLAFGLVGDDDEDDNAERMLKNWMHDYLPGPVEDYLTKGIWGWFDGPDPSARFSMGGLMNPLAFARFDDTERGEDTLKEIMFRVFGGATGASAAAIWDGLSAVGDGDYTKAGEKLLPLKFLRDLAKTVTLNTEGLATGKGEQRLDPNDFSVVDSIWQAMGIQPAKKTNYYDRQGAIQAQKQAVEGTRDKLLAEYGQARLQGKDVSSIVVKITRFNQRNPHARIKAENLRQAVDRRKTNRRETDATGMLVNKSTRPYLPNARWTE